MTDIRKLADLLFSIPVDMGGGSALDKIYVMAGLAGRLGLKSYVEIGVYRGRSLLPMALSFAARGGRSYGIDPYLRSAAYEQDIPPAQFDAVTAFIEATDYDAVHDEFLRRRDEVKLASSCELLRETSARAGGLLRARGILADMVHIDGNHDRAHALADVMNYIGIMTDGAILVLDDIDWPSVGDALSYAKERMSLVFETATYAVFIGSSDGALIRDLGAFCRSLERHAQRFLDTEPAPRVSVSIITYNQERYIGQAIESALSQKTDFDVELVVGEDCSSDATLAICRDYRDRYPDRIHLVERPGNLGAVANYLETYKDCRGEYVAFLEGDDFWTDPLKLQKQVDFLDAHRDYAICFHNVLLVDDAGRPIRPLFSTLPDTSTAADLCEGDYISTPSCMVRNRLVEEIPAWMYTLPGCDWPFDILNAEHGKIKFIDQTMAAYRLHGSSIWSSRPAYERFAAAITIGMRLDRFFGFRYRDRFARYIESNRRALTAEMDARRRSAGPQPERNRALPAQPLPVVEQAEVEMPPARAPTKRRGRVSTARKKLQRHWRRLFARPAHIEPVAPPDEPLPRSDPPEPSSPLDLIVLDDAFPHPHSGFRLEELDTYLAMFERMRVFTTGRAFSFFKDPRDVREVIAEHDERAPALLGRTLPFADLPPTITARCGYAVFAGNAWENVAYLEASNIPFVFTLYPGGSFYIHDPASDERLRRVFGSPMFRKVIVTQKLTFDYIIDQGFCEKEDIEFIYGVVTPTETLVASSAPHIYYKNGKERLDICFTAHKYTSDGHDKGYDIFLDVARMLAARFEDCHFHVVGGFGEDDLSIAGLERRISFYGLRDQEWLRDFYRDKDLILLCNIPFVISPGAFDGFPTACGSDAMLNEVALFCTDPLNLNCAFVDGRDIVIVPYDVDAIVEKLSWYREHPHELAELARNGRKQAARAYSFEAQLAPRLAVLRNQIESSARE
ncbi:glycosyltransferase [Starkeya koreensis]|uniref:Glycosyltransferase n=1 Tax=Ancylobacter koreensis TaxID=266121 RepID=A0ABT0DGR2_9HYPH|nr:glycosyltransferase [Ancylobacter koreensis]MCK0206465.1 glycosyltransferase [Ancylobacter koreensis]